MGNEIYVLNRELKLLGVIDEYVSIIWRPSYSEVGDFEIYMGATAKAVSLLSVNNYVVRKSDISVDNEGNETYKKVMVIKKNHIVTDVENGDFLTVTGRELKFLLNQRIVWRQTTLTGTVENAIRKMVNENAINPSDPKRVIDNLMLGTAIGLTDTMEKQLTGSKLDQAIVDICKTYNYGWEVYIHAGKLVLDIYTGLDRSHSQTELPYVVFSDEFENLYSTEYQLNIEEYANTALIGGEGEGLDRIYAATGDSYSGLERYETFVDARDVSRNKDNDDEIPLDTYLSLLQERGREKQEELSYTEGFSGEVLSDMAFRYGKDFYLGDTVTVINKYGIVRNARVLSAIESENEEGIKLIPQFNI